MGGFEVLVGVQWQRIRYKEEIHLIQLFCFFHIITIFFISFKSEKEYGLLKFFGRK